MPYSTQATALTPNMPGSSPGSVQAQVWQQTGSAPTFSLIGSATLTITDTRPIPGVTGITPGAIDLGDPPASRSRSPARSPSRRVALGHLLAPRREVGRPFAHGITFTR